MGVEWTGEWGVGLGVGVGAGVRLGVHIYIDNIPAWARDWGNLVRMELSSHTLVIKSDLINIVNCIKSELGSKIRLGL
jgi:hypothetical protein